jgi:hypothetical protein
MSLPLSVISFYRQNGTGSSGSKPRPARRGAGRIPEAKVVELFDVTDLGVQSKSVVPVGQSLFKAQPNEVTLVDYEPFKPITVLIKLTNIDNVSCKHITIEEKVWVNVRI